MSTAKWGCSSSHCGWFGPYEDLDCEKKPNGDLIPGGYICPKCRGHVRFIEVISGQATDIRKSYQKTLSRRQIATAGSPASRAAEALEQKEDDDEQRTAA